MPPARAQAGDGRRQRRDTADGVERDVRAAARPRRDLGGRVAGARSFTARNDQARTLTFPRTRRLDRAIRRGTPVGLELAGFRSVESDFGKDRRGTLLWRITL